MNIKRKAELALLIALCISLCGAAWARGEQLELADKMIRLHVIADSDDSRAQELKIMVRDRVLEIAEPMLRGTSNKEQAQEILNGMLPTLEAAAREVLGDIEEDVTISLDKEFYPTRRYESFALPAGEYLSLKITIGSGEGKNWWCVVFPPLCMGAAGEPVSESVSAFDAEDIALITETEGYVLKFKTLELWGKIAELINNL